MDNLPTYIALERVFFPIFAMDDIYRHKKDLGQDKSLYMLYADRFQAITAWKLSLLIFAQVYFEGISMYYSLNV